MFHDRSSYRPLLVVDPQPADIFACAVVVVVLCDQQTAVAPGLDDVLGWSLAFAGAMPGDHGACGPFIGDVSGVAVAVAVRQSSLDLVEDLVNYRDADVGEQFRRLPHLDGLDVVAVRI